MTRLTEADVTTLTRELGTFEARLLEATGLDLRGLALRAAGMEDCCVQLRGARIAAVPMTAGDGVITGFTACVVAVLLHLGCDAWASTQPDVRGIQAAVAAGAGVLFLADQDLLEQFAGAAVAQVAAHLTKSEITEVVPV